MWNPQKCGFLYPFIHLLHKYLRPPCMCQELLGHSLERDSVGSCPRGACILVGEAEINQVLTEITVKWQKLGRK